MRTTSARTMTASPARRSARRSDRRGSEASFVAAIRRRITADRDATATMIKADAEAFAAMDREESPQDGNDGIATGDTLGMGERDEDAVDRERARLGKAPINARIVFGDGSPDEVAAECVGERDSRPRRSRARGCYRGCASRPSHRCGVDK
jgi:hypothetical protein